jgi:prepilin-type N-terminal cleavage/methylation domain-containing protein
MAMKKAPGVTLIELLMAISIMGILFGLIPTLLIQMTQLQRQSEARVEIQRDARAALDIMNRILREAKASTITVDNKSGQPFYSRITFKTVDSKTYLYYQDGKNLQMASDNGVTASTRALTENLLYLSFTYPRTSDNRILSVSLTTEKSTYEQKVKNLQLSVEKVRIMNE